MKKWMTLMGVLMTLLLLCAYAAGEGIIPVTLGPEMDTPEGVTAVDGVVTFSKPGSYLVSGDLPQGSLVVDCAENGKVILYLNGVSVYNAQGPALRVGECSPRAVISLVEGAENRLSNGTALFFEDVDEPDGVIYSQSDLTIEGGGTLEVSAGAMNGIVSKDDLRIEGGSLRIDAPLHGIKGKDSVEISGGEITIHAGKDGVKSTNKKDPERGFLEISGGKLTVTCGDDPLSFITTCHITGGEIHLSMAE